MTALLVLERADLDDVALITPEARGVEGGRIYAEAGWSFTVRDLLWGLLLQSGNDAAVALAQKVSPDGSVGRFAQMMSERAAEIGAENTQFRNPHGLDEAEHYSTAYDLALIATAAMRTPVFAEMVAAKTHDVSWGDGTVHTFINHNRLLFDYPGAIGIKTGFTAGAGNSLASAVSRDGVTLIAVVLGSPDHYAESIALYDWGFSHLAALRVQDSPRLRLKEPALDGSSESGLEVVQVGAEKEATSGSRAPVLAAPVAALFLAWGLMSWLRKRRRRQSFASVEEFRDTLQTLARSETILPPGHNGSSNSKRTGDVILPAGNRRNR